jgi:hypothetical protein
MLAKARHIQPGEKYEKRTYMRAVRSHSPTDARQAGPITGRISVQSEEIHPGALKAHHGIL